MSRKTVHVKELIMQVNVRLETPDSTLKLDDLTPNQAFRLGAASVLEWALHATENYAGFKYQSDQFNVDPWELKQNYDSTRRTYYIEGDL